MRTISVGLLTLAVAACGDASSEPTEGVAIAPLTRPTARPGHLVIHGFGVEFAEVAGEEHETVRVSVIGSDLIIELTDTTGGRDPFGNTESGSFTGRGGEITFRGGRGMAASFLRWAARSSRAEGDGTVQIVLRGVDGAEVARFTFQGALVSDWGRVEPRELGVSVRYESLGLDVPPGSTSGGALGGLFGGGAEMGQQLAGVLAGGFLGGIFGDAGAPASGGR